jgi:hypothetical protein
MEQQPYQAYRIDEPCQVTVTKPKQSALKPWTKARLIAFGIAALIGLVSSQWEAIDKYFPALNRVIHSGTPTSQDDFDYHAGHIEADEAKLGACKEDMTFKQCRDASIAIKPVLDDMHEHFQSMISGWEHEKAERSVPPACQERMDHFLNAFGDYLKVEYRSTALMQSINPDSIESIKAAKPSFDKVENDETAALEQVHKWKPGAVCDGY